LSWLLVAWNTGGAVLGDAEIVVLLHGHLEETVLAPVGTPGVSADPVLLAGVGDAPSNYSDLVVDLWEGVVLLVDTSGVGLELVGSLDTARDWAVLVDLLLHLFGTGESVVVRSIVLLVINSPAFVLAVLSNWAWWPGAVLAHVDGFASEALWIMGNVLLA